MSSVFFGVTNRTYHYDRTIGRAEFAGAGFRQPMDLAISPDGIMYVVNRCWEYRPDGVRVTMVTFDEELIGGVLPLWGWGRRAVLAHLHRAGQPAERLHHRRLAEPCIGVRQGRQLPVQVGCQRVGRR